MNKKTVSHYEIIEQIGVGGMGAVYKARDTRLGRIVALKFLPDAVRFDERANARFLREAKAASELDHPNICTIYEIDKADDGRTFIAMAYYEGRNASDLLKEGPLAIDEAVTIVRQVAEGLVHAHGSDVIHRDIKSANIVITQDHVAKLVDFGLAKLEGETKITKTGTVTGTPAYMSPEQARGEAVDRRSDLFSLGVTFYELIAGALPFRGDSEAALLYSITHLDPAPLKEARPEAPDEIVAIIDKLLEKDVADRYQTAEELIDDLERVSQGRSPLIRRKRKRARVFAAAALVIAGAAALWLTHPWTPRQSTAGAAFVVAVLPFASAGAGENEEGLLMQQLIERELKRELPEDDVAVVGSGRLKQGVSSTAEARELGRSIDANVVAWGEVFSLRDEIEIQPYITIVSDFAQEPNRAANPMEARLDQPQQITLRKASAAEVGDMALLIAGAYYRRSDPDKSLAMLGRAEPTADNLVIQAGVYLDQKGDPDKAEALLTRALEADSTHLVANLDLARVLLRRGDHEGAMQQFRRTIAMHPRDERAYEGLVFIGSWFGDREELRGELEQYRDDDPTNPWPVCGLGIWHVVGGEPVAAIEQFKTAIALNPTAPMGSAYQYLAATYEMVGDIDQAMATLERGLELDPEATRLRWTLLSLQARRYRAAGDFARALALYNEQLELDPSNPEIHLSLARTYSDMDRIDEAVVEYRRAIEFSPQSSSLYFIMGWKLSDAGHFDEAEAAFKEGVAVDPNSPDSHRELGEFYRQRDMFDEALDHYEDAAELAPEDGYYKLWPVIALAQSGKLAAAREAGQAYLDAGQGDNWPSHIVRFYAGDVTGDSLLAESRTGSAEEALGKQCEASYYVGMAKLTGLGEAAPDTAAAIDLFRECVATERTQFLEYMAAEFQLEALGEKPSDLD